MPTKAPPHYINGRAPCHGCGGDKGPGQGVKYCPSCRDLAWTMVQLRKHPPKAFKRCRRCQETKPVGQFALLEWETQPKGGTRRKICDSCAVTYRARKPCVVCLVNPKVPGRGQLRCEECLGRPVPDIESPHRERFRVVTRTTRQKLWERDEGICGICGTAADPDDWHADHVVPRSRGGINALSNLQVSHPLCNIKKGNRA
jgi:5-methylcytosine-specific restriction endonuclease McrA